MKSLKQNYDKHLVVTIIVLVALPILLGWSTFVLISYSSEVITFFGEIFNNFEIGYEIGSQFLASLIQLQYVIFVVMLVLYPVYPFIFSLENHLSNRNPKSAVTEYQALKKIVYALLPIFFFEVVYRISSGITPDNPLVDLVGSLNRLQQSILASILAAVFFAVASALLRIILLNRSKHFKFYLARLSLRAMLRGKDDLERMNYLIQGFSLYNKYIRRTLGLQINNLKLIYSKIIADRAVDKNHLMKELCQAFEDSDKLKPITCLTVLFNVPDPEHFLVKESIGKKLQDWGGIIGTLASAIAAVIGAILTLLGTSGQA
jgi:hypothetical protein